MKECTYCTGIALELLKDQFVLKYAGGTYKLGCNIYITMVNYNKGQNMHSLSVTVLFTSHCKVGQHK